MGETHTNLAKVTATGEFTKLPTDDEDPWNAYVPAASVDIEKWSYELTDGKGEITDLVCTFPDDTPGTEWAGPFAVGTQFGCTGTVEGLEAGETHRDTASVTATGAISGVQIGDEDDWNAHTDPAPLPNTGASLPLGATLGALALLLAGAALLLARRGRTMRAGL